MQLDKCSIAVIISFVIGATILVAVYLFTFQCETPANIAIDTSLAFCNAIGTPCEISLIPFNVLSGSLFNYRKVTINDGYLWINCRSGVVSRYHKKILDTYDVLLFSNRGLGVNEYGTMSFKTIKSVLRMAEYYADSLGMASRIHFYSMTPLSDGKGSRAWRVEFILEGMKNLFILFINENSLELIGYTNHIGIPIPIDLIKNRSNHWTSAAEESLLIAIKELNVVIGSSFDSDCKYFVESILRETCTKCPDQGKSIYHVDFGLTGDISNNKVSKPATAVQEKISQLLKARTGYISISVDPTNGNIVNIRESR